MTKKVEANPRKDYYDSEEHYETQKLRDQINVAEDLISISRTNAEIKETEAKTNFVEIKTSAVAVAILIAIVLTVKYIFF